MKKLLRKIKWGDVRILLACGVVLFLFSFSNKKSEERTIDEITVNFRGNEGHFVTEGDIQKAVKNIYPNITTMERAKIDLHKLENTILKNDLIRNAEVYLSIDGRLMVNVWQKKAIGRVVLENDSFYIDETGNKMPLSSNFAERVPLIQGMPKKGSQEKMKELLELINQDEFLKEDIAGINLQSNESIVLLSRLNNYDIIFGGFDEIAKKLNNYKTFVQYTIDEKIEVDSYKTINLRFTQQVVCTK
ncbi:MAG: cell division protein FtsQ/DivIB [Flavobacteriaceae bacterium]|nr:cell division protein FtsQ/DivIB [Flavobacteriaceae bacterium]